MVLELFSDVAQRILPKAYFRLQLQEQSLIQLLSLPQSSVPEIIITEIYNKYKIELTFSRL